VARERRVMTPDGRVWYVRRRWAKRRRPWDREGGQGRVRFAADAELPNEEAWLVPLVDDTLATARNLDGRPDFFQSDRYAAANMVPVVLVGFMAVGLLIAAFVHYVLPWLVPVAVANARLILGVATAVVVLVVLDRLQRPWLVELRRQGLADAPGRVWRVRGWRRSERLITEVAAAIRDGRIDTARAVILFSGKDRGLRR
jgi:hypothetical protein